MGVNETLHQVVNRSTKRGSRTDNGQKCQCDLCIRGRDFKDKVKDLDPETREFLEGVYEALFETEDELNAYKIYLDNVKELNPEVFKKAFTINKVKLEDSL